MTYRPRRRCKVCGADRDDVGGLSRTGLCGPCGAARLAANVRQLQAHAGPGWAAWLAGMADATARLWGTYVPEDCRDLTNGEPVSGAPVGDNLQ